MVSYPLTTGSTGIRGEVIDSMIKQVAKASYKFKQACAVTSTSDYKNSYLT